MSSKSHGNALPEGYRLLWYRIGRVLGQGGFGITYEAFDTNLEKSVAIKEYLPTEFAVREADTTVRPFTEDRKQMFEWGLDRFLQEARTLAKFHHPNIVLVHNVFEKNGTAYMAMQYEKGEALHTLFRSKRLHSEKDLLNVALPLLDGIEHMHDAGFIHRDIKPPNIFIRLDGTPVLLDFGSARFAIGEETKTLTSLVSPGFAPYEQYHNETGKQGPWTDIYGLGATLYAGINRGRGPLDAIVRGHARIEGKPDPLEPAKQIGAGHYSDAFLGAIDAALGFTPAERPASVAEWRAMFPGSDASPAPATGRQTRAESDIPTVIRQDTPSPSVSHKHSFWKWLAGISILAVISLAIVYVFLNQGQTKIAPGEDQFTKAEQQQLMVDEAVQRALQAEAEQRKQQEQQARIAQEAAAEKSKLEQQKIALEHARLESQRAKEAQERAIEQKQEKIASLLREADRALSASRLTSPAGDNAMEYFQSVLKLDNSNIPAKKGIGQIVTRYLVMAESAAKQQEWEKAETYIGKADAIDPGGDSVLLSRNQIATLREQAIQQQREQEQAERKKLEQEQRLQQQKAAAARKLRIALVTFGDTPKKSAAVISENMKRVFMKNLYQIPGASEVEIITTIVNNRDYFSSNLAMHKSVEYCEQYNIDRILGLHFYKSELGPYGEFIVTGFDCKQKQYTNKTYDVEFDRSISKWGPEWKRSFTSFISETGLFNKSP